MKKETKNSIMNETTCDLNKAKDEIYSAVEHLQNKGLSADAESLMSIIFRIEKIQNKYNCY